MSLKERFRHVRRDSSGGSMPTRPGISAHAFSRLEDEIIGLAGKLSDWQLMELADDFHAMLRQRQQALTPQGQAPNSTIRIGENDNLPMQRPGAGFSGDR